MLWFVLCLCLVSVKSQGGPPKQVEFGLTFTGNPYICDGSTDWCDVSGLGAHWFNESTVGMGGIWDLKKTIEPCTMVSIMINKEANGNSETVMTLEICDLCDEIGNPDSKYYKYMQNFMLPEKCPVDPGQYLLNDVLVESSDLPINSANSGAYKIFINMYKLDDDCNCKGDKTYLACIQFDCMIEPI